MWQLNHILSNANHNARAENNGIMEYSYWLIDNIEVSLDSISVIIRNIKGETIEDN